MNLFANLRPAICYPALADASSLKRELVDGPTEFYERKTRSEFRKVIPNL